MQMPRHMAGFFMPARLKTRRRRGRDKRFSCTWKMRRRIRQFATAGDPCHACCKKGVPWTPSQRYSAASGASGDASACTAGFFLRGARGLRALSLAPVSSVAAGASSAMSLSCFSTRRRGGATKS